MGIESWYRESARDNRVGPGTQQSPKYSRTDVVIRRVDIALYCHPSDHEVTKPEIAFKIPVHSARRFLCAKQTEKVDPKRKLAHYFDDVGCRDIREKHDPGTSARNFQARCRSGVLGA